MLFFDWKAATMQIIEWGKVNWFPLAIGFVLGAIIL